MGSEPESLADRILHLRMEQEADPVAQLLLEVRREARATRELLEAVAKKGGSGGNGRGWVDRAWDLLRWGLVPWMVWVSVSLIKLNENSVSSSAVESLRVRVETNFSRTERNERDIDALQRKLDTHISEHVR